MRHLTVIIVLSIGLIIASSLPGYAELKWIDLPISSGGTVKALLGIPQGIVKAPSVVYSHGTAVRRLGYDGAKTQGYDIVDFVKFLNSTNYVVLAPVRDQGILLEPFNFKLGAVGHETTSSIQDGIEQGIASLQAAVTFLRNHATATGKVGTIGFSEGGLVTTWAMLDGLDVDAVVLMSPATIKKADRLNMKNATQSKTFKNIKAPVLITLGKKDNPAILKGTKRLLIPALKNAGVLLKTKLEYPGDHRWFWRVRTEYFPDVLEFLNEHLN